MPSPVERNPFMLASMPQQGSGSAQFLGQWLGGPGVPRYRLYPVVTFQ
jgi:hypothetical protein